MLVFGIALLMILGVLNAIGPWDGSLRFPLGFLWIGAMAVSFPTIWWFRRTHGGLIARASGPGEAASAYHARLLLGIAFAETHALVAFVLAFEHETLGPYLISLPISLVTMWFVSPREADIRNVQRLIDEAGGTVNLADALMGRSYRAADSSDA